MAAPKGPSCLVDSEPVAMLDSNIHVPNALDPATFIPPNPNAGNSIIIEFCDRCRWLHRATWMSTELFLTFPPPFLSSISLVPLNSDQTGGRFRVWLNIGSGNSILLWDRKTQGGFPELKLLKQQLRDHIQPGKSLGHSDIAASGAVA